MWERAHRSTAPLHWGALSSGRKWEILPVSVLLGTVTNGSFLQYAGLCGSQVQIPPHPRNLCLAPPSGKPRQVTTSLSLSFFIHRVETIVHVLTSP